MSSTNRTGGKGNKIAQIFRLVVKALFYNVHIYIFMSIKNKKTIAC